MKNRKVYLAGPDVFFPDASERSEILKIQCDLWGLDGIFPLDSEIELEDPLEQEANGYRIFSENIKLIKSCSAMLANITPFRGPSLDAGTAFEIGYGFACGLLVVGYTASKEMYKDRVVPDGLS